MYIDKLFNNMTIREIRRMLREKGECKNAKVHKYPDGKYYLVYTNLPLPRTDFLIKIPKNFTPSDYIETIIEGVII